MGKPLKQIYQEVFNIDNAVDNENIFNHRQKLYIVAEEVSPVVCQVSEYLRDMYNMNVNHLEYEVLRTKDGEFLISVEKTLGFVKPKVSTGKGGIVVSGSRWSGTEKVKDVIHKGILEFTHNDNTVTFSPKDTIQLLIANNPEINTSTVRCQIIQDCVNHTSRKHYPNGQQDHYFLIDKGTYRLYNPEKDGKWNWEGKRI